MFLLFLVYPDASTTTLQFFVCNRFDKPGEDDFYYLRVDMSIDCEGETYAQWKTYAVTMLVLYPLGVPGLYALILFKSRHALYRMKRFEIESEDVLNEGKLRKKSIDPLTLEEFQKIELLEALELEELERVEEKKRLLERKLPVYIRKLTSGYRWRYYWFEVFECIRKIAIIALPIFFKPG